jgi:hypothetical protein
LNELLKNFSQDHADIFPKVLAFLQLTMTFSPLIGDSQYKKIQKGTLQEVEFLGLNVTNKKICIFYLSSIFSHFFKAQLNIMYKVSHLNLLARSD